MGYKLYIGNLPFHVTDQELQSLFTKAGKVESVKIITDLATGQSRGFGFVEMGSTEEGEKAIESVLDRLKNAAVDAHDLEKAKNQQIAAFVLRRQRVQAKANAVGRCAVLGKDVNCVNTEMDRYVQVSAADIQRVAREYFVPAQRTVMMIEPPNEAGGTETPK